MFCICITKYINKTINSKVFSIPLHTNTLQFIRIYISPPIFVPNIKYLYNIVVEINSCIIISEQQESGTVHILNKNNSKTFWRRKHQIFIKVNWTKKRNCVKNMAFVIEVTWQIQTITQWCKWDKCILLDYFFYSNPCGAFRK